MLIVLNPSFRDGIDMTCSLLGLLHAFSFSKKIFQILLRVGLSTTYQEIFDSLGKILNGNGGGFTVDNDLMIVQAETRS
jgi:hypothetical protein